MDKADKKKPAATPELPFQDPHGHGEVQGKLLEQAIGREVKGFREKLGLTIAELAKAAEMSAGMLSKIENGATSPSLASLQALGRALQVPVTAFFKGFEEIRDATFVKAGQGLTIERRGTRAGHQYQLLGHSPHGPVMVEPYLITLTAPVRRVPDLPASRASNSSTCSKAMSCTGMATRPTTCIRAMPCSSTPTRHMDRKS